MEILINNLRSLVPLIGYGTAGILTGAVCLSTYSKYYETKYKLKQDLINNWFKNIEGGNIFLEVTPDWATYVISNKLNTRTETAVHFAIMPHLVLNNIEQEKLYYSAIQHLPSFVKKAENLIETKKYSIIGTILKNPFYYSTFFEEDKQYNKCLEIVSNIS